VAKRRSRQQLELNPHARLGPAVRLLWWGLCLGVLAWWLFTTGLGSLASAHGLEGRDDRLFYALMALISFPAGLIWVLATPWLLSIVPAGAGVAAIPWYGEPLLAWFGCAIVGYLQWFWLLPRAFSFGRQAG
jgi:hypothetical protein